MNSSWGPRITLALGGKWYGDYGQAPCPAHTDKNPSLSIKEENGKILVYCHAGCTQQAVLAALNNMELWKKHQHFLAPFQYQTSHISRQQRGKSSTSFFNIKHLWDQAEPIKGSPAQNYLSGRRIRLVDLESLRFHPGLYHSPSAREWPTMLGLVVNAITQEPVALHRTFLNYGGNGKAPVGKSKMMLGPSKGGIIALGGYAEKILVGEGIETSLSAMQATGISAWAALSSSLLSSLNLPPSIKEAIILVDGGSAGETASQRAAHRWALEGKIVRLARAGSDIDFNDLLMGHSDAQ